MNQKSIITIAVGVFVLAAMLLASNQITSARLKALETESDLQKKVEGYQRVETLRTTFLAVRVIVLLVTGMLAFHWWKPGVTPPPGSGMPGASRNTQFRLPVYYVIFPGIIAVITSFTSALLEVLAFNEYGGVGSRFLVCVGLPAGVFGMLAGLVWYAIRRRSGLSRKDVVPLFIIGILSGLIPGALIKMLPQ